jgi:hypothetical protein
VRKLSGALLFLIVATATRAEWKTVSTRTEFGAIAGLEHRHVVLENPASDARAIVDLAVFSAKSCALRVIDNSSGEGLADAMVKEKCGAGVNGGYFDPDFAPVGLRIVDGRQLAPLLRARLLTGVLISSPGGIKIVRPREFSNQAKIDAAIECGPMIVDLAAAVPGLDRTRSARRTFAAVDRRDHAALGACSGVTLAELAQILAAPVAADFKIQRALNLDGGSSSAFWFKGESGNPFSISEQKTVRDFVGVVSK